MSITKMTWTAQSTYRRRKGIDTNPDYQRPAVWTRAQKQLLIDSMLRDYDIPKFYLHRTGKDTYDLPYPLNDNTYNFSFSGIKSAVINLTPNFLTSSVSNII